MDIIKLEKDDDLIFNKVCEWNYNWWGIKNNYSFDEIKCFFKHSLGKNKLPQTFVCVMDNQPVGMYQFLMMDDLRSRPDIYPWLANVFVDEKYRGQGICKVMMNSVKKNATGIGFDKLYLYTGHVGLYEKYGWKFVENVETFRQNSPIERLYELDIRNE